MVPDPATCSASLAPDAARQREGVVLREVCMHFKGAAAPALDHINATIPYGDITGLVGPDAAG